jgi:hypothetical protein
MGRSSHQSLRGVVDRRRQLPGRALGHVVGGEPELGQHLAPGAEAPKRSMPTASSAQRSQPKRDARLDRDPWGPRWAAPRPVPRPGPRTGPTRASRRPGRRPRRRPAPRPRRRRRPPRCRCRPARGRGRPVGSRPRRRPGDPGPAVPSSTGRSWRLRISAVGPSCVEGDPPGRPAVSLASAGRMTDRPGMARSDASCSTGWWVGPSSPTPTESWVQDEDDLGPTARPGGPRTHVVAEHEEGAADREHAAVQGHAVHAAAHGVLADAEVDLAPAGVVGEKVPSSFEGTVPVLPVRSAPPPTRPGTTSPAPARHLAARCGWPTLLADLPRRQRVSQPGSPRSARQASISAAVASRSRGASPTPRAGGPGAGGAVELEDVVGHVERSSGAGP